MSHPTTLLPRGVHVPPCLDAAGDMIAMAVTSDHRCICWLPFTPETKSQVAASLWAVLDRADPERVLRAG